jgi:hypothetical protein
MNNIHPFPSTTPALAGEAEIETRWSQAGRKRIAGRFLKKTPLDPLHRAAKLPGRTLHLYLAIRHRCDLQRSQTTTLPSTYLRSWGIDKHAKSRALEKLEGERLITVDRCPGRTPVVTLL